MDASSGDTDPAEIVAKQLNELIQQVEELVEDANPLRSCDAAEADEGS